LIAVVENSKEQKIISQCLSFLENLRFSTQKMGKIRILVEIDSIYLWWEKQKKTIEEKTHQHKGDEQVTKRCC